MKAGTRWTSQAAVLGVAWVLGGAPALAGEAGAAVPERGCPARPELVPLTSMAIRGAQRDGWLAHQALIPEARDTFFQKEERQRTGWKQVTAEQARKLGAADPAVPLWVFGGPDKAACRATPTQYWVLRNGEEEWNTYLVSELQADCELPGPGSVPGGMLLAVRQKEAPTGCMLRTENFRQGALDQPLSFPEVAAQVPARACAAPACELRWDVLGSRWEGGATVYDVMVSWGRPQKGSSCRKVEEHHALLVKRPADAKPVPLRKGGTYLGSLYDRAGVKTVLSTAAGVLYVHEVARPQAAPAAVNFNTLSEEEMEHSTRSLAPECEH